MRDHIVLMSGGIDSTACAHYLKEQGCDLEGLFIDYGQKSALPERSAVSRIGTFLNIPISIATFSMGSIFGQGELVGRNSFLVFTAMMRYQLHQGIIGLGIHAGTTYYDCSSAFLESANRVVAEYTDGRVRLIAPFIGWHKQEIIDYCKRVNLPLDLTYSCENGELPPCGKCQSCRDRRMLDCHS